MIGFSEKPYEQEQFKIQTMENKNIAFDKKTEDFDFKKHFVNALLGALYYVFVYILIFLPFKIWGKAATRISLLWERKSLEYSEETSDYPVLYFYFLYLVNFILDAIIFLIWPLGFLFQSYLYFIKFELQTPFFNSYILVLIGIYLSVIAIKIGKEILYFFLNVLLKWFIDVVINIGKLIKNAWLLNFIYKKKGE